MKSYSKRQWPPSIDCGEPKLRYFRKYHGRAAAPAERSVALRGVISGVFRFHDLLVAAGAHVDAEEMIDLVLVDETPGGEPELLHEIRQEGIKWDSGSRYEKPLNPAGGRWWTLIATPATI